MKVIVGTGEAIELPQDSSEALKLLSGYLSYTCSLDSDLEVLFLNSPVFDKKVFITVDSNGGWLSDIASEVLNMLRRAGSRAVRLVEEDFASMAGVQSQDPLNEVLIRLKGGSFWGVYAVYGLIPWWKNKRLGRSVASQVSTFTGLPLLRNRLVWNTGYWRCMRPVSVTLYVGIPSYFRTFPSVELEKLVSGCSAGLYSGIVKYFCGEAPKFLPRPTEKARCNNDSQPIQRQQKTPQGAYPREEVEVVLSSGSPPIEADIESEHLGLVDTESTNVLETKNLALPEAQGGLQKGDEVKPLEETDAKSSYQPDAFPAGALVAGYPISNGSAVHVFRRATAVNTNKSTFRLSSSSETSQKNWSYSPNELTPFR